MKDRSRAEFGVEYSDGRAERYISPKDLRYLFYATLVAAAGIGALIWVLRWSPIYWSAEGSMTRSLTALVAVGASMYALTAKVRIPAFKSPIRRIYWASYAALLAGAAIVTSFFSLDNFPTSADEYAYLFQARTFEAARLWNAPKPLGQAVSSMYAWAVGDRWVGQYPPFWPAVLAVFDMFGPSVRLANAVTITIIGFAIAYVVRRRAGRGSAWLAAGLFALSPFAIFNGASLTSHPMAAALGLAALIASLLSTERQSLRWSVAAGLAIGLLGMTRLVAAPVFAIVILLDLARGKRRWIRLSAFGAGGLPSIALLGAYQNAITGSPFRPVYWLSGRTDDHLYFDVTSILHSVKLTAHYLIELNLWTSPFFLILWVISFAWLCKSRKILPIDLAFPIGVCLFLFYPINAGIRFGPRYYFDFWPCAVVTIGSALRAVSWRYRPIFRRGLILSMCFGLVSTVALFVEWRRISWDREQVYRLAASANLHNAILCMDDESGTMLPLSNRDYPRNGITADTTVLFVRCSRTIPPLMDKALWKSRMAPVSIEKVRLAYPSRSIWTYTQKSGSAVGKLVLVRLPQVLEPQTKPAGRESFRPSP